METHSERSEFMLPLGFYTYNIRFHWVPHYRITLLIQMEITLSLDVPACIVVQHVNASFFENWSY